MKACQEKRLPAIANSAVWEKVTKGRAGTRWDNAANKVWNEIGGNQEEIQSIQKFGGYKAELNEKIYKMERLALKHNVEGKNI